MAAPRAGDDNNNIIIIGLCAYIFEEYYNKYLNISPSLLFNVCISREMKIPIAY